jgi:DNA-binding NarL/FixJ family response regulator
MKKRAAVNKHLADLAQTRSSFPSREKEVLQAKQKGQMNKKQKD